MSDLTKAEQEIMYTGGGSHLLCPACLRPTLKVLLETWGGVNVECDTCGAQMNIQPYLHVGGQWIRKPTKEVPRLGFAQRAIIQARAWMRSKP